MALDPNRWTLKTQEAFNAAVELARASSNPEVTPDHLVLALIGQEGGVVLPILQKVGVNPPVLRSVGRGRHRQDAPGLRRRVAHGRAPSRRCSTPPTASARELDDEYLSTEHLLLALADRVGVPKEQLLDALHAGARQPPRHQPEPRGPVPGAREVRPRPHRGGPRGQARSRSSAATTRSAASSRCCRAAPRTTRCSSASRASARPPSSRAWPAASSRATCPRACATSGSSRSTCRAWSPAPSTAASSRSGSRPCSRRSPTPTARSSPSSTRCTPSSAPARPRARWTPAT